MSGTLETVLGLVELGNPELTEEMLGWLEERYEEFSHLLGTPVTRALELFHESLQHALEGRTEKALWLAYQAEAELSDCDAPVYCGQWAA